MDVERGRTVKDWKPKRLGGGLGKTRVGSPRQNQRFSGRDPSLPGANNTAAAAAAAALEQQTEVSKSSASHNFR